MKTEALEAIIAYDTIAKARQSKEQIEWEIAELNRKYPSQGVSLNFSAEDSSHMETLQSQLDDFSDVESEFFGYLENEYNMQGEEIDDILTAMKNDSNRLD